ncbi:YopX family protein [Desulfosporosinus youngiae]|uniref:YopX protein n=1 Tax=Desulfosporosinus youngiae DSM 17734 TaxID=768710 RepID=H5Y238_9FIRM|nr:YopX family protein [Desulfosporosinus youngiae]EHQ88236.1 YopX protein [Desulfosporosinus youngiae DSM 17734]
MREIKFRAWIEPNIEKIPPYMSSEPEFNGYINDIFSRGGVKPLAPYGSKITYLQFTGLRDKNGKEIYEGDMCDTYTRWGKGVVRFEGGMFKLNGMSLCTFIPRLEVIGNIYENPELLEVTT